jgi:ferredoxin
MTHESRSPGWQLHIDWTRCEGRGLCCELLPELLARDDWGYPLTHNPTITRSRITAARDAVALCPRQALTMTPPRHRR